MDKYLIVGLGNPGDEYAETRHNTGFMVLDAFAKASNIVFEDKRYGFVAETTLKGRKVFLLKPTTFMNLSGNAVRYWLNKENIEQSRLLVISDDVAIPVGQFRLKANGSNGGHNGELCPSAYGHRQRLSHRHADRPRARTFPVRGNGEVAARHQPWCRYHQELCPGRHRHHDESV